MATFTRDWNEALPTDDTMAVDIDDYNRYLRVDCSDRLKAMVYGFTAGENDGIQGFKKLTFKQRAAAPDTPAADQIELYALDDGTNCGLSAIQEDGYTKQILKKIGTDLQLALEAADITADMIDDTKIRLTNDSYLRGRNNAGDGDIDLIKVGTNDLPTLLDASEMASNAAPTEDEGIVNKKYVDDQVTVAAGRCKGWASVNANGTTRGSYNVASTGKDSTGIYTITWDTDFADTNYSVVATIVSANAFSATVHTKAVGSCKVTCRNMAGTLTDLLFDVIAFGTQ